MLLFPRCYVKMIVAENKRICKQILEKRRAKFFMANEDNFDVKGCAEYLRICTKAVYGLCREPGFPAVRVSPRRIVIPRRQLDAWLEAKARQGDTGEKEAL